LSFRRADLLLLVALGALLLLPAALGPYSIRMGTLIFMWAALAGSWNLLAGYAGAADLGPVVHYGIGAFATALLMTKGHLPFPVALLLAGVLAAGIAFVVGKPTLRLRGAYFAIGTLALAESAKQLALAWDRLTGMAVTGGSAGVSLPLSGSYVIFYYLMLGILTVVTGTALWLGRSKFGYGLRAIGENERLAEASGVDLHRLKLRVYVLSAIFIAWTGGTQGYWLSYINASEAFGAAITFQMVVMALVGGLGTPFGPLLGAAFLTLVSELLGTQFVHHYLIAIGVIIVVLCLFLPTGLVGATAFLRARPRPGSPVA
jgi:branched-chain amino acid transport system permease protein